MKVLRILTDYKCEQTKVQTKVLVPQSCPTLCDPMDCSPPGSSVPGILQARILEWVVIPSPGNHQDPGIKPGSLALQVDSLPSEPSGKPKTAKLLMKTNLNIWAELPLTKLPYHDVTSLFNMENGREN